MKASTRPPDPAWAIILYDGECIICHGFVSFVLRQDRAGRFRFAPWQGETAARCLAASHAVGAVRGPHPDDLASVGLIFGEKVYARSEAVLRILVGLGGPWRLARILRLLPLSWRDRVYDALAKRRHLWPRRGWSCRLPTPSERERLLP